MKKEISLISYTYFVAVFVMSLSLAAKAQYYPISVIQDNYWIDSLKMIPQNAHAGEIISVAAYTTHSSGGCDLKDFRIWKCRNFILVDATYEQGMLTYICHSADTIPLGSLLPGNYTLLYDWLDTIRFKVYPNQQDCRAYFTYTYLKCLDAKCINTVAFQDSSRGDVISWLWEFGDGKSSEEINPVHTYENPGVYEVCLKIKTSDGCTSTWCEKITVGLTDRCKADFGWEEVVPFWDCNLEWADCITPYYYVQFKDMSRGPVWTREWDFGDGSVSTEQNPFHEYKYTGTYDVCLKIRTSDNCVDSICKMYDPQSGTLVSGVNDIPRPSQDLTLYPNPASGEIHIQLSQEALNKDCTVTIMDMYGRKLGIYRYDSGETADGTIGLNVANLNNGQYICTVIADSKLFKSRFTVIK